MNGRPWSARDIQIVRDLYPNTPTQEIARRLQRSDKAVYQRAMSIGLHKSAEYLAGPHASRLRRGDNIGAAHRYAKGHVPANKGLRRPGWSPGRMRETQFRKGNVSKRWDSEIYIIGSLRLNRDGYVDMKVSDGMRSWRALHRIMWEDVHGPVPKGFALCFKDRDPMNFDSSLANVELISRADLCRRNSIHNLPPELKSTIHALGQLKRRIRERTEREDENQRPA